MNTDWCELPVFTHIKLDKLHFPKKSLVLSGFFKERKLLSAKQKSISSYKLTHNSLPSTDD